MKKILIAIGLSLLFAGSSYAANDVTFQWDRNSENDLAGYRLYQSLQSGNYENPPIAEIEVSQSNHPNQIIITNIEDGTYYWVLTAFDQSGNESGYSNEVTASLDSTAPNPPRNFLIELIKKIISWLKGFRINQG